MPPSSRLARPVFYDDAYITSLIGYGESDCIVRMLTKSRGRITAFFKRGLAQRKGSGSIQAPLFAQVGLIEHPHKMPSMVSCDGYPSSIMPQVVKVFAYQSYLAELLEKLLPEEEPALEIFDLVQESFEALAHHQAKPFILRAFELKILNFCGYLPEIPDDSHIKAFDPVEQKFVSELQPPCFPFSHQAIQVARSMLIAKVGSIPYEGSELMMIGRIFHHRLKVMGLLPLKSVDFLKQVSGHTR